MIIDFILFLTLIFFIFLIFNIFNRSTNIHKIYGKIVKNKEDIKKGLMHRKDKLKYNEGMLFLMRYKNNSMWMKNTYIPLDIIFLDDNMKILGYIENTIPLSLDSISIDKKSNNIIEMNSGSIKNFNMKIKDKIIFIEDI